MGEMRLISHQDRFTKTASDEYDDDLIVMGECSDYVFNMAFHFLLCVVCVADPRLARR